MSSEPGVTIQTFTNLDAEHLTLLLEADPSERIIRDVFTHSRAYEIHTGQALTGVMLLVRPNTDTVEIADISVNRAYRRQGFGSRLIDRAKMETVRLGLRRLEVGTGSTSFGALCFYQTCGFRMDRIERNYFARTESPLETWFACHGVSNYPNNHTGPRPIRTTHQKSWSWLNSSSGS